MAPRSVRAALIAVLILGALARLECPQLDPAATLYTDVTDEGWWAASAARAVRGGPLVLPGDYNPVLITPTWTALLVLVFSWLGPSLAAARLAAGACGALAPVALWWAFAEDLDERERALAAALLALSFVAVAFSRMAILEAPLMLALIHAVGWHRRALAGGPAAASGAALAVGFAILTKTSALALVPVLVAGALLELARGTASRAAAMRTVVAALAGAAALPAFGAWASTAYPAEWAMMVGLNVGDKVPRLTEIPAQALWFLGFNQLVEDAPMTVLAAWVAAGAVALQTMSRPVAAPADAPSAAPPDAPSAAESAAPPDAPRGPSRRDAAPFAALWFLAMVAVVAVLPYQPKRYHMLTLPPACLLTAVLCVRASSGAWERRTLLFGLTLASGVLGFIIAMGRIRASGAFIPQLSLHPDNVRQLLRDGLVASGALAALVVSTAFLVRRPLRAQPILAVLLVLELGTSVSAWLRWRTHATDSVVQAARAIGERVRARPPSRLAGSAAHTVSLETGVETRWLSIDPRFARRMIPTDPLSHVLVDDARDLPIWREQAPALSARLEPAGSWTVAPEWPKPTQWQLFALSAAR